MLKNTLYLLSGNGLMNENRMAPSDKMGDVFETSKPFRVITSKRRLYPSKKFKVSNADCVISKMLLLWSNRVTHHAFTVLLWAMNGNGVELAISVLKTLVCVSVFRPTKCPQHAIHQKHRLHLCSSDTGEPSLKGSVCLTLIYKKAYEPLRFVRIRFPISQDDSAAVWVVFFRNDDTFSITASHT